MIGKLIKLEYRLTKKFMFSLISISMIAIGVLLFKMSPLLNDKYNPGSFYTVKGVAALAVLILLTVYTLFFFYMSSIFSKDLYEDRGYLTFSLPVSSAQLAASKIIISLMWAVLIFVSAYAVVVAFGFLSEPFKPVIDALRNSLNSFGRTIAWVGACLCVCLSSIELMYLSVLASKNGLGSKKLKSFWLLIYIILQYLVSYSSIKIFKLVMPLRYDAITFVYYIIVFYLAVSIVTFGLITWLLDKEIEI